MTKSFEYVAYAVKYFKFQIIKSSDRIYQPSDVIYRIPDSVCDKTAFVNCNNYQKR